MNREKIWIFLKKINRWQIIGVYGILNGFLLFLENGYLSGGISLILGIFLFQENQLAKTLFGIYLIISSLILMFSPFMHLPEDLIPLLFNIVIFYFLYFYKRKEQKEKERI